MSSPQSLELCRDLTGQDLTRGDGAAAGSALVMKGSGVRVPASALRSFPAKAVVPSQRLVHLGSAWGLHGVWNGTCDEPAAASALPAASARATPVPRRRRRRARRTSQGGTWTPRPPRRTDEFRDPD